MDQLYLERGVIPGHDHGPILGKDHLTRHVSCGEVELGAVLGEKRLVASTLLLR